MTSQRVIECAPSTLIPHLDSLGLVGLVQEGYRLHGTDAQILRWVEEEFTQPLTGATIFYSLHPDRSSQVGAFLIVGRLAYGDRFGLEVGGIIVAKDYPRRGSGGVADELMRTAVKKYDPDFVIGATCNVRAMILRTRVLTALGYQTMAGAVKFTPQWNWKMVIDAERIEECYVVSHGGRRHDNVIVDISPEYLEPIHESMRSEFPSPYDFVQAQLFQRQAEIGRNGTACVILQSMKMESSFHTIQTASCGDDGSQNR